MGFAIIAWLLFLGLLFLLQTEEKMKAFWVGAIIFINLSNAILFFF
jgi:hypothetical protein